MKIRLASASPRRAKILAAAGVDFEVVASRATEVSFPGDPEKTVRENALAKAAGAGGGPDVLAADTIVWYGGRIYGKPQNLDEAAAFLRELSGKTHVVFTGVAFGGNVKTVRSRVKFRNLSENEIREYVDRVKPVDRAGAYDIDESGDFIVERYGGSYENIMGLPLEPLAEWGILESQPVGFFDSGFGGISVLREFWKICPGEDTLYLADRANCPYGNRPADEILRISRANTETLLARGAKAVVVACNTATAAAIDVLRREYPSVPFVGIEPGVKPAALETRTGVVGVIATAGTFGGRLYRETKAKFAQDVTVLATVADEFVEMVESKPFEAVLDGAIEWTADDFTAVEKKIAPLLSAGCDTIVLGCTHFPHLKGLIEKAACGKARVVDTSAAVARQISRILESRGIRACLGRPPARMFIP